MSAAVNNHQLPSYMSGFLYPLGNKKGVYSFVSKPRRVEHQPAESEIIRENILIKRKLKPRLLRNRNKKLKKKTLLDVKSIECIEGDKTPIQRLHRNKTKLSGQTVQDESLAKTETQNINRELRVNIEETEDQQSYKESFINSEKVQKVIESLTSKTIEETVKELIMENSFLKNEQIH